MNKHLRAAAAAAAVSGALAISAPAQAATYLGTNGTPPVVVADYSSAGLISFDIDFLAATSATLRYGITAADLIGMGVTFNAVLRNLAGTGFSGYGFGLSSGAFEEVGTVTRQFGGSSSISFGGSQATVTFSPLEFLDVEIGDPLLAGGNRVDWSIDGLDAGAVLSITVTAVPEPATYAL
ncbi:MAG: hypothetical protein H7Z19_20630, partial [Chitinophagaceae bacterium]|nr:hypothetical protein [Rubrivivax sp.]